jgi:hypothetical protein
VIKALKKLEIEGMYLNLIKAVYEKPIANIIFNEENLKPFPLKSRVRETGCLLFLLILDIIYTVRAVR